MSTRRVKVGVFLSVLFVVAAVSASAAVTVPSIIGDHMVLQQGMKAPIWGKADPTEAVTVKIGDCEEKAVADAEGRWQVALSKLKAGGPFEMTIAGESNTITVSDILVGEVWVGSGQSNMAMAVRSCNNADQEIAEAGFPSIRLFSVERKVSGEPVDDCVGAWTACTPETVPGFSAALYFFGRELHKELDVPLGLVHTSWGGTPAEAWTSYPSLEANPEFKPILDRWENIIANYPATLKAYEAKVAEWKKAAEKAKADGKPAPKKPRTTVGPGHPHRAAGLFNGMIAPILPYAIQGAIWYQGESNASRAYQYRALFPAMIEDWREAWDQGPFPFLFVQLANFRAVEPEPAESDWAELREAQTMTLSLKNTGMAVIIDIGEAEDIHPKNKQDVGKRLALAALAETYDKEIPYSGPIYKSMKVKDGEVELKFDHTDGGLVAKGGEALKGFAIAGADKKFVWADAVIDGKKVVVSSDQVPEPVAVRYAWAINPVCNLYNGAALPASPFRTDDWPGVTVNNK